jgi:hypothetical protein
VTATNARGTTTGPDQQLSLPRDTRPEVITGVASRRREGTAKVEGRLNPLGKATTFWFEYGPTAAYGQRTTPRYGGLQITPRLVFDTLRELTPGVEYHYRLMATNETGTSQGDDATFRVE